MEYQIIVFIDGSSVSIFLLNQLIKVKKFNIKFIILSPGCETKIKDNLKNKYKKKLKISNLKNKKIVKKLSSSLCDMVFSYYDKKIPKNILDSLKIGGINFHPSYLPYNKGRHSTFWAINNGTPFGATAHWLNDKIDHGDIFIQKKIKFNKFENAKIIYDEHLKLLKKIIINTINLICKKKFFRKKQNNKIKDYHFARDIKKLCNINFKQKISNVNLANLIRSTCYNDNTGLNIILDKKVYFVVSKYIIKKKKYKNEYLINVSELYKNITNKKKFNYKIYLKNYEINVCSKITRVSTLI